MSIIPKLSVIALLMVSTQSFAQSHMQKALDSLDEAKASLNRAADDKGPYKRLAIKAIEDAKAQVQAGIEYDRKHYSSNENKKK